MLAAAPRDFERLRRKHEKPAGEQRHHGEHVEVYAIGARWVRARLLQRFDRGRVHPGRQQRLNLPAHLFPVGAGRQPQVDAVQLAEPAEAPLRGRDVGERAHPSQGGEHLGDLQLHYSLTHHELEHIALSEGQGFGCGGGQEHAVRRQQLVAVLGDELRLQDRAAQDVDARDAQRALGAGDAGVELERRARHRHSADPRDLRIETFGEPSASAAHLEIGSSRDRAHGRGHVADRGAVDEVHAVAERHPECDAGDRQRHAPARAPRGEKAEQPEHRLTIRACVGSSSP